MKVEFETAREAAQRMGVTVRAVQKWAASGKIPGATRMGKAWMIPKLVSLIEEPGEHAGHMIDQISFRRPLPLTNGPFPPGEARAYAESLPDPDDRRIALGEYYYFTGNAEKAVEIAEEYMDSEDPSLAYSARMICLYANLTMGHIRRAQFAAKAMFADLEEGIQTDSPPILHAIGIFTANVIATQIQLEIPQLPPLETYIRYLPGGMKQFSMYLMALQAYQEKNYERCIAIADMGCALPLESCVIAEVNCHMIAVCALMSQRKVEQAQARMRRAWEIGGPDQMIMIPAEHYELLQGSLEILMKRDYPQTFEKTIKLSQQYTNNKRWVQGHSPDHIVKERLTMKELTVATLYDRGWTALDIAQHMELSERTVRNYINTIYAKLGITDRKALGQYMNE